MTTTTVRLHLSALAALTLLLPTTALALRIAAPSTPQKVAQADLIVIGKVSAITSKTEKAELYPGDTSEMKVATVRVEKALLGKPGSSVKVGFVVATPPPAPPAGGGVRILPIRRGPSVNLTAGQEALFFVKKHPTKKDVYVVQSFFDVVDRGNGNPNFKAEADEVQKYAKLLADPMAGLKAKSASERFETAGLLVYRYKAPGLGANAAKTEAVPAAESKLILEAIAGADWAAGQRGGFRAITPQGAFAMLGATPQDGWKAPANYADFPAEAQKWLKGNAGKFKLQRFVREKVATGPSEEPDR